MNESIRYRNVIHPEVYIPKPGYFQIRRGDTLSKKEIYTEAINKRKKDSARHLEGPLGVTPVTFPFIAPVEIKDGRSHEIFRFFARDLEVQCYVM